MGRWSILVLIVAAVALPVAGAQARLDIFVTPVPNAPFTGTISVERRIVAPDGSMIALKTARGVGRDSRGRIFNEARALVPSSSDAPPILTAIHLYDPQTRVSTLLDPRQKTYRSDPINRPPAIEP